MNRYTCKLYVKFYVCFCQYGTFLKKKSILIVNETRQVVIEPYCHADDSLHVHNVSHHSTLHSTNYIQKYYHRSGYL